MNGIVRFRQLSHACRLLFVVVWIVGVGCESPPLPGGADGTPGATPGGENDSQPSQHGSAHSNAKQDAGKEEFWETYLIRDTKAGHAHTRIERIREQDRELVRVISNSRLALRRFRQVIVQELEVTAVETPDGRPVRFESRLKTGDSLTVTRGRLADDGKLHLEVETAGNRQTAQLDWQPQYKGLFGMELSLRNKPMRAREQRRFQTLVPVFNEIGTMALDGRSIEATKLPDGTRQLLRINATMTVRKTPIETVLWVDEQGRILKSLVPTLNKVAYRVGREDALRPDTAGSFDIGEASVVRLDRALQQPHRKARIAYRVKLKKGDPAAVFPVALGQQVRSLGPHSAEITVSAVRPDQPAQVPGETKSPVDADLQANNYVQIDDPQIVAMANSVAAEERNAWKLAVALERHVKRTVRSKNFSQAFATAAEVVKSREGDCTEHAVLLAALCRVRKIPARVAIGLVYYPAARGFAYHMWNEVWIKDRWIPLDGTLGHGGIGGGHLKLAVSSLDGADAYGAFLPVFSVLGDLQITVLDSAAAP